MDVVLLVTTVVVAVDSVTLHGPSEGYLVSRTQNLNIRYSNQKLRKEWEQWIIHLFSNPLKMLNWNNRIFRGENRYFRNHSTHLNIDIIDLNMEENDQRFMMRDRRASEEGIRMITANPEGKNLNSIGNG